MSSTQYSIHIHRDTKIHAKLKNYPERHDHEAFVTFEFTADEDRAVMFVKRDDLQRFKDVITDALVADGVKDKVAAS